MFPKFDAFMLSFAGATLALLAMILIKKIFNFSTVMVSVAGGLAHNVGQIIVACFLFKNTAIASTIIPLFFIGTITGILIGVLSGNLINRIKKHISKLL
jgi:heptaprenyl diphosphate synthase